MWITRTSFSSWNTHLPVFQCSGLNLKHAFISQINFSYSLSSLVKISQEMTNLDLRMTKFIRKHLSRNHVVNLFCLQMIVLWSIIVFVACTIITTTLGDNMWNNYTFSLKQPSYRKQQQQLTNGRFSCLKS